MKLFEVKEALEKINEIKFVLPGGNIVPVHFHVTEIGAINRHFVDCGGVERIERKINFQLWEAGDFDHRLAPEKLKKIIELSIERLGLENLHVEVEYQMETIGRFDLDFDGTRFLLKNKHTDCLAKDKCGITQEKQKVSLASLTNGKNAECTPGGGCC